VLFYFDVLKDRLYTAAPHSVARRAAQTAIWRIGEALVRLLASHHEFYQRRSLAISSRSTGSAGERAPGRNFPRLPTFLAAPHWLMIPSSGKTGATLRVVREEVLKALEEARNNKLIGGSLEAQVKVVASDPVYSVLARYQEQLRYLFIVSEVVLERGTSGNGTGGVLVQVGKAAGQKCERCWNYSTHVGDDPAYPTIWRTLQCGAKGTRSRGLI